jgi:putative ABC transport system substrate-binding protein
VAQSKQPLVVIGWLNLGSRQTDFYQLAALKEGLAALGYREGQQFSIDERWADSRRERLQLLAEDLAARKPAIIVASASEPLRAAVKASPTTPIVLVGADPVQLGVAKSLARPGGTVTGLSNMIGELREKYIELLVAAAPNVTRIGVLHTSMNPPPARLAHSLEAVRRWATQNAVEVRFEGAAAPEEIDAAVLRLAKQGAQGLVVFPSPLFTGEAARIAKLAFALRLPLVGGGSLMRIEPGALLSYGADAEAMYRRAAYYVDRILKGAKPGDLPVEQPTTFELVVNLKTAKALGLTMPPEIMVRATRVIQY